MNNKSRKYNVARGSILLAFTLLATAGCTNEGIPSAETSYESSGKQTNPYGTGDTPQKTYLQGKKYGDGPNAISSNPSGGDTSAESSGTKSNANPAGKWDAANPVMMGLKIGDSLTKVSERFGNADDIYSLQDESEKIEVHEYKGFAIGMNAKKTIQYIEVYDRSITTGLSGLGVEDKTDKVVKALGKPTSQNSYIISYQGNNSLLKFDLDPEHDQIVSIKLLAET
ncbi:hypothetical protein [Paenibacillus glycanilyticus]|uniref:DUF4309 domain-containing protein n=1 Tax=Paenibacillus glycanilyticus TaxID=126569 RepID=A0ABQ6GBY3_9BACL|nr:hypothetical protein [Paenibacillus glycanilyticus]GLX68157.1 hypothetical protein MU1_25020 [Paenibacillus glycanilyticus]